MRHYPLRLSWLVFFLTISGLSFAASAEMDSGAGLEDSAEVVDAAWIERAEQRIVENADAEVSVQALVNSPTYASTEPGYRAWPMPGKQALGKSISKEISIADAEERIRIWTSPRQPKSVVAMKKASKPVITESVTESVKDLQPVVAAVAVKAPEAAPQPIPASQPSQPSQPSLASPEMGPIALIIFAILAGVSLFSGLGYYVGWRAARRH